MYVIMISCLEWVLSKLPSAFSRWYWTEEKISENIIFDVRPRHSPVEIWFSDGGLISVSLQLENRNRIPVTVDRILAKFLFEGKVSIPLQYLERVTLMPTQKLDRLTLSSPLSADAIKKIHQFFSEREHRQQATLSYTLEIDTNVRNITKKGDLDGISHIDKINMPADLREIL